MSEWCSYRDGCVSEWCSYRDVCMSEWSLFIQGWLCV